MKNLLIILALTLGLSCCKNDDDTPTNPIDQLPPATQTGENTFGCLVNGEPFVVTNTSLSSAIYQGNVFVLSGSINNGEKSISFNIYDGINQGETYSLTNLDKTNSGYSDFTNYPTSFCQYLAEDIIEGQLRVNYLNQDAFIVSGSFEFSVVTNDCEKVNITEGRFDMKYIP